MLEKTITLDTVELVSIYGVNNNNLDMIRKYFPKIRIVARGNEIKAIGNEEEIERFEDKINLLIAHYQKYHDISPQAVEEIMLQDADSIRQMTEQSDDVIIYGNNGRVIKARNKHQISMIERIARDDLIFAIGPAGTGKTYLAIALAVRALRSRQVKRIILSRPAVEAEEHIGFLPGDMKEKLDPYLQPLYDALDDMIPPRRLSEFMRDGIIQIAPLAFMRGRTLSNAFVILDEAQNATQNQLKMFLTRMGENAKFIVTGDITQIDLPRRKSSGLLQSRRILKGIKGISMIEFDEHDIVRHNLVKHIVAAYEKDTYEVKQENPEAENKKTDAPPTQNFSPQN